MADILAARRGAACRGGDPAPRPTAVVALTTESHRRTADTVLPPPLAATSNQSAGRPRPTVSVEQGRPAARPRQQGGDFWHPLP